jgi:hypothetical protein
VAGEIYDVFVSSVTRVRTCGTRQKLISALRVNGLSSFFPLTAACNPEPEVKPSIISPRVGYLERLRRQLGDRASCEDNKVHSLRTGKNEDECGRDLQQ